MEPAGPALRTSTVSFLAGGSLALFNLSPDNFAASERALPGRRGEFQASVDIALRHARATGAKTLQAMAGNAPSVITHEAATGISVHLRQGCDRRRHHPDRERRQPFTGELDHGRVSEAVDRVGCRWRIPASGCNERRARLVRAVPAPSGPMAVV